jgi:hypothetical protein
MYNTAYIHFGCMKFGVIQCSSCKTARGVKLSAKTVLCSRCSKRIVLSKARILCKVENERELAHAVMKYNAKLGGGEKIYAQDLELAKGKEEHVELNNTSDIYDEIAGRLNKVRGRDNKIEACAKELCYHLGEFTEADFNDVLARIGIDKDKDPSYIDILMANNVIYQPKNGIYKCL